MEFTLLSHLQDSRVQRSKSSDIDNKISCIEYSLHDFVDKICKPSENAMIVLCMLNWYKSFTKVEELQGESETDRKERVLDFFNYVNNFFTFFYGFVIHTPRMFENNRNQ